MGVQVPIRAPVVCAMDACWSEPVVLQTDFAARRHREGSMVSAGWMRGIAERPS